jgi:malate dehydrogenase
VSLTPRSKLARTEASKAADSRLFGVTHLDIVRASTFVSSVVGKPTEADKYKIPVVGGHSGVTILPLLTQSKPSIVS